MKHAKTIYYITTLLLLSLFLFTCLSQALVAYTITISSSGTISALKGYIVYKVSDVTHVKLGSTNTDVFSSLDAKAAFDEVFEYVSNGGVITVQAGTYVGSSSFMMSYCNNVNLTFMEGAIMTIANSVNDAVLRVDHSNNNVFTNLHIDGNKANQKVPLPYEDINGITLTYSDNNIIQDSYFTNCKRSGVESFDTDSLTIQNSLFTYNGWNGITIGGGSTDCSVLNNEVAHSSDVGISSYGENTLVSGNYVHDIDTMDGSPVAGGATVYNNSHWGIGQEDGSNLQVIGNVVENCDGLGICLGAGSRGLADSNTISNCAIGISTGNTGYNTITHNTIINWHYNSRYGISSGIHVVYGTDNTISFNILTANSTTEAKAIILESTNRAFVLNNTITTNTSIQTWNSAGVQISLSNNSIAYGNGIQARCGIVINSGSTNNTIYQNNLAQCVVPITDSGTGTIYTNPF